LLLVWLLACRTPRSTKRLRNTAVANRGIVIFPIRYDPAESTISDGGDKAMREDFYGSNSLVFLVSVRVKSPGFHSWKCHFCNDEEL